MKKYGVFVLILAALILLPNLLEAQCAMCKASVESSQGQKNSVANNLNSGILYLMAVPYVLIGFIFRKQIVALWRNFRGKPSVDEEL